MTAGSPVRGRLRSAVRRARDQQAELAFRSPRPARADVPVGPERAALVAAMDATGADADPRTGVRITVDGTLDEARLHAAVERVVVRNEALRTRVEEVGGVSVHRFDGEVAVVHDAGSRRAVFDPRGRESVRVGWERSDRRTVVEIVTSRLALDRRSVGPLLSALAAAYDEVAPATRSREGLDGGDLLWWVHRVGSGAAGDTAETAEAALGHVPPSRLPFRRADATTWPAAGPAAPGHAPAAARVTPLVRRSGPGLEALTTAAEAALRRHGVPTPVRLAVRTDDRPASAADVIGPLSTTAVVVAGRHLSAGTVAELAGPVALGTEPLLPVVLDHVVLPPVTFGGAHAHAELVPAAACGHDLELTLVDRDGDCELLVEHRAGTVDREAAAALGDAVRALLADPVTSVAPARRAASRTDGPPPSAATDSEHSPGIPAGDRVAVPAGSAAGLRAVVDGVAAGVEVLVEEPADPPAWTAAVRNRAGVTAVHDTTAPDPELARPRGTHGPTVDGALLLGLRGDGHPRVLRLPGDEIVRAAGRVAAEWELDTSDVVAVATGPACADPAVVVRAAELAGARTVLVEATDPEDVFDELVEAGATVASLPARMWDGIPAHLLDLRVARCTGGAVHDRLAVPEVPLAQVLGAGRLAAAGGRVLAPDDTPTAPTGVGTAWLPVATGVGYHDDPRATADRLRPDPHGPPGSRRVAASVPVRLGPDGLATSVHPDGSADRVQHDGRVLEVAPLVERCAALTVGQAATTEPHGDARVTVTVLPADGPGGGECAVVLSGFGASAPSELRAGLAGALPDALVPAEVRTAPPGTVRCPEHAATWVARALTAVGAPFVPPADDLERDLAEHVLAPVFGVDRVGRDDDMFALGGSSLQLIRALVRVQEVHGVDLPLAELFVEPTLARLAALVREATERGGAELAALLDEIESMPPDTPVPPT